MIKTVATLRDVERKYTKAGKEFSVVTDSEGRSYSIWSEPLTEEADRLKGQKVAIGYDEQTKGQYTNRSIRTLTQVQGDNGAGLATEPGDTKVVLDNATDAPAGDYLGQIKAAASRGEWRAAESILRREDIARSVALNNTLTFFQYLKEEDRSPTNVKLIFDYMLEALKG